MMAATLDQLVEKLLHEIAVSGDKGVSFEELAGYITTFRSPPDAVVPECRKALLFSDAPPKIARDDNHTFTAAVWEWIARKPDIEIRPSAAPGKTANQPHTGSSFKPLVDSDLRLYATEEQVWRVIAGHGVDHKLLPDREFECLRIIAASGPQGCLQPDLTRISGQDKRSVPKRTDNLCAKGYIVKESIISVGMRTTKLKLRKYAGAIDQLQADVETKDEMEPSIADKKIVSSEDWYDKTIQLIQDNGGAIVLDDLRAGLGIRGERWQTRAFRRCWKRLVASGLFRQIRAKGENSSRFVKCLQLIREPKDTDKLIFGTIGEHLPLSKAENLTSMTEEDTQAIDDEGEFDVEPFVEVKRSSEKLPPQWTPSLPFNNLVFNIVDNAGIRGISALELTARAMGSAWRKPLDEIMQRLTDHWDVAQPSHLLHLTIIRESGFLGRYSHYLYRSRRNFEKAVENGVTAWEAVQSAKKAAATKRKHGASTVNLDRWGFPALDPRNFPQNGCASLRDCQRSVTKDTKTSKVNLSKPIGPNGTPVKKWQAEQSTTISVQPVESEQSVTLPTHTGLRGSKRNASRTLNLKRSRETVLERETANYKTASKKRAKLLARIEAKRNDLPFSEKRAREIESDLLARSKPGVYINPPEAKEIFLTETIRIGRPRKSMFIVFKSSKLCTFPWFVDDVSQRNKEPELLQNSSRQPDECTDHSERPRKRRRIGAENEAGLLNTSASQQDDDAIQSFDTTRSLNIITAPNKRPLDTPEENNMRQPIMKRARTERGLIADQISQEPVLRSEPDKYNVGDTEDATGMDQHLEIQGIAQGRDLSSPWPLDENLSEEIDSLPDLKLIRMEPRRLASSGPVKDGSKGIVRIRRENIVMDIVRKSGGIFPGDREMWYPFITAWRKSNDSLPDRQTVEGTVNTLVAEERLIKMSFDFHNSNGDTKTSHILLEPGFESRSLSVKRLQQAMIYAHPRPYVPELVEVAPQLQRFVEPYRSRVDPSSSGQVPLQATSEQQTPCSALRGKHQFVTSNLRVKRPETVIHVTGSHLAKEIMNIGDDYNDTHNRSMQPPHSLDALDSRESRANADGIRGLFDKRRSGALSKEFDSISFIARPDGRRVGDLGGFVHWNQSLPRTANSQEFQSHASLEPVQALHMPTGTFGNVNPLHNHVTTTRSTNPQNSAASMRPPRLDFCFSFREHAIAPFSTTAAQGKNTAGSLDDADAEFYKSVARIMRREITLVENATEIQLEDSFLFLNLGVKKGLSHSEEYSEHGPYVFTPVETIDSASRAFNDETPPIQPPKVSGVAGVLSLAGLTNVKTTADPTPRSTRQSHTIYKSRKRSADVSVAPDSALSASVQRPKRQKTNVDKLSIPSERLDDDEYDRLFICIALGRLLCSMPGNREYPWVFIQHGMKFKYDEKRLSQSWNQAIRRRQGEVIVQLAVQNLKPLLLQAYEDGNLPTLDFEHPHLNDWPKLVRWAESQLLPLQRPEKVQRSIAQAHDLPKSRSQLQHNWELREAEDCSNYNPDLWCDDARDYLRTQTVMCHGFGTPLTENTHINEPGIICDPDLDQNLILIKSIARSIVMTDVKNYDAEKAAQKILSIGIKDLQRANDELLASGTFAHVKAHRVRPGRNYRISSYTFDQFRRWQCLTNETKLFKEVNCARDEISLYFVDNDEMEFNPNASEAENLVLLNMESQGHIEAHTAQFTWDNRVDALPPALSIWGWREDILEHKWYQLGIPLKYVKSEGFQVKDGLKRNVSVPTQSVIFPGEPCPRIPFWIDINGNVLKKAWAMVLRSMLHLLLFRPGSTPKTMEKAFKTKLWAWEISLVLGWMEKVGIAERLGTVYGDVPGWKAGEWWYCAFAPGVTPE